MQRVMRRCAVSIILVAVGGWAACARADEGVAARVMAVSADTHAATLVTTGGGKKWVVTGADLQKIAGTYLEEGDLVTVTGEPPADGTAITIRTTPLSVWSRVVSIAVPAIVLVLLAALASGWQPQKFLLGADQRVSNSKCQVVLWFGVAMTVYLATLAQRIIASDWQLIGGIAIPANVLAMTGLSGLTYAGAKMIAVSKNNGNPPAPAPALAPANPNAQGAAAANLAAAGARRKIMAPKPDWLKDLFTNDQGELDFGDFQMILVVWISVLVYVVSAFTLLGALPLQAHVTLPDVDGSLLAAFGIGQGAYLAKKAALPVGAG